LQLNWGLQFGLLPLAILVLLKQCQQSRLQPVSSITVLTKQVSSTSSVNRANKAGVKYILSQQC
jgi:hypothetical protein